MRMILRDSIVESGSADAPLNGRGQVSQRQQQLLKTPKPGPEERQLMSRAVYLPCLPSAMFADQTPMFSQTRITLSAEMIDYQLFCV
jgi:hypothetical protein